MCCCCLPIDVGAVLVVILHLVNVYNFYRCIQLALFVSELDSESSISFLTMMIIGWVPVIPTIAFMFLGACGNQERPRTRRFLIYFNYCNALSFLLQLIGWSQVKNLFETKLLEDIMWVATGYVERILEAEI